ncbi:LysR family transcriptional regulator [Enterobacter cloacae]|uniref:LysR family transcriptional regulator n=1 Tax=Enterobacter cloacae TaxID=550 RepID=UPI0013767ADF|nr:LysR family transcriptional regulator [Enterobacter cloacae]ELG6441738.1 LysR family transcriptional regulator [Enterobacter cloacae]MCK1072071.1 LysR family transcriptional regulator [Enterobacter cloacae subsp. cloacae]MCQ9486541.1 LysR family transcriptional regulator [Enterobacter cloacae]MCQ9528031.1 LysR family transcriptional regulator [Enterobacter cloacae]MCQ9571225.1 LysR family transcriptional regulator [Enterobacter cloacae]
MMNKLQLKPRELKIISVIAATHSIGDAAALLGMAQANVSKYLSDFETRVGLKVFERTTRQLALTQFGEALLPYVNATLDKNSQLINFIADYKHEKRGKVTIYAPTGIVTYLSRHVIHQIKDIGDIRISLKTYNLDRNEFSEGVTFPDDCDILITYAQPKDESLVASVLTQYSVTAFATEDYLNQHPLNGPEDLIHHSCILIDSMLVDDANIWRFRVHGSDDVQDYRVTGNYICDNTQTALELARNNLGIVFAPKESLRKELKNGSLVPCFPHQEEWWLDLTAIFRKREYQPWRVQYVLDGVLNNLRQQIAQAAHGRPELDD